MVMQVSKVQVLPATFTPDTLYIVGEGTAGMKMFMTDKLGTVARPMVVDVNTSFDKYDLSTGATTGVMDLAQRQVFTLTNNDATLKTLSVTNAPANKAMTVVLHVIGKAGNVKFPVPSSAADGVDANLGDVSTIFVMLVMNGLVTVTTNLRINTAPSTV